MSLVVEISDLQTEEKMQKTKITFHKAIESVIKKDLIISLIIEGIMLRQEVVKIYQIGLIQLQEVEQERCIMLLILIIQKEDLETIILIKKNQIIFKMA